MFFKFTLAFVFVLVLICLPTSQATRFLNDEKLGSVEQGQAGSPHVTNPTNPTTGTGDIASMITEKVFVTDHYKKLGLFRPIYFEGSLKTLEISLEKARGEKYTTPISTVINKPSK
jgi:hypothetical protein